MNLSVTSQRQNLNPEMWSKKHQSFLTNMAFRKLPKDIAEDIVQDTFLAALKAAHSFKGISSERSWLAAILKHKIADHYRAGNPKYGRILSNTVFESELPQWQNLTSIMSRNLAIDGLYEDDLNEILVEGMATLNPIEIEVLELKIKGYSTEAICMQLDITPSYCWVSLCRARKKIKEYLSKKW